MVEKQKCRHCRKAERQIRQESRNTDTVGNRKADIMGKQKDRHSRKAERQTE
jgi:hypothetical protein